jgi:hypothetical protein
MIRSKATHGGLRVGIIAEFGIDSLPRVCSVEDSVSDPFQIVVCVPQSGVDEISNSSFQAFYVGIAYCWNWAI